MGKLLGAFAVCAALLLAAAPRAVFAQEAGLAGEIAKCAELASDLRRLDCYDKVAGQKGVEEPKAITLPAGSRGKWRVREDKNPLDDSRKVTLHLTADSGKSAFGESITLAARCDSNKTELYIAWEDFLGSDSDDFRSEWKHVTVRVDDRRAQKERWNISTDQTATFSPKPIFLLKEMAGKTRFVARTVPYAENPVIATFDITGLENALVPLMDACGWSL